jgi:hypothetical protein
MMEVDVGGNEGGRLRSSLDLLVALAALATSISSIWLALAQGDDMQRLVQAQSWPYIGFHSGNSSVDEATHERVRSLGFTIVNQGVGPARVRWMEVSVDGRAVPNTTALMLRAARLPAGTAIDRRDTYTSGVQGRVLRAGEEITFLRWQHAPQREPVWSALDKARFGRIVIRTCYCSVFDECWISHSETPDPLGVAACPALPVPFRE